MAPRAVPTKRASSRVVDPSGTDDGAAAEINDLVKRKTALSGLEPTKPKFGNPIKQVGDAVKKGLKWVTTYDPYKKKGK